MSALTDRLENMLITGADTALLRFSIGNAYLKDDPAKAAVHFKRATEIDSQYSAAWKLLGKSLSASGNDTEAIDAYRQGIEVAEKNGDKQAAREMQVFLRRLETRK